MITGDNKEIKEWTIPGLMNDVKLAGGQMEETRAMIVSIIKLWSDALAELDGNYVIDIDSTSDVIDISMERNAAFAEDVDLVSSIFEKPYSTRNFILSDESMISPKDLHDMANMVRDGDADKAKEMFIKKRDGLDSTDVIDVSSEQDVVPVEIPSEPEPEEIPEFGTDEYKVWLFRLLVDMKDVQKKTFKEIVAELEAKGIKGTSGNFISITSIGGRIRDARKYLIQVETA